MSDWVSTTLGQLISTSGGSIKTGPFGTTLKAGEYAQIGVPVVSVGEVGYGSLRINESTPRVPKTVTQRLPEYLLAAGDVVFGRKGAVDRSAWVKHEEAGWFLGSDGIRLRLPDSVNSRFVSYQLRTSETRKWLLQHAAGTTMASLNHRVLERVPLRLPSLYMQRAIANVLGALDDKIAANLAVARTSEDLLATEFAALRIDEEPARESSSLTLTELIELNPIVPRPTEKEPVYVAMQQLPVSGMSITSWSHRPAKGGARFQNGDTLLARITPCLENRKAGYVDLLSDGQIGLGSTEYIVMRSRSGVPLELSYFIATSERFRTFAIRHMSGTSGRQRVSAADLADFQLIAPDQSRLLAFGRKVGALFQVLKSQRDENLKLAQTRDVLLPRLMSGKLRVKDVEKRVEEVL